MTENLVLVIPDSLRADFWPDWPGTTVDVVAAGAESPTCIPTMLTGRPPDEHGIEWFHSAPTPVPTVFDLEGEGYDVAFWDNPEDLIRRVLRAPQARPLDAMEPPFVYVVRLMHTHHPYGVQWSDLDDPQAVVKPEPASIREFPGAADEWETGRDYLDLMRSGDVDFIADYRHGIDRVDDRVEAIRETLGEMGVADETTVIVAADHGEAWGGQVDDCSHFIHTHQPCRHIVNVKATVLDREVAVEGAIRQQDLLALWDERWRGGRDDLRPVERDPEIDESAAAERLEALGYL